MVLMCCVSSHLSSVEVRISELSEIRIYSDHLTDRKLMPQIRIPEYTIFRAFSSLCSSSFSIFSSTMVYLFLVTFLYGKKSTKIEKTQKCKNHEKMLYKYWFFFHYSSIWIWGIDFPSVKWSEYIRISDNPNIRTSTLAKMLFRNFVKSQ